MTARLTWAAILSIVMIPMLAVGFLDPLEGIVALVPGLLIGLAVRLLSKVKFPRFTWISVVVVAALMVTVLALVIWQIPQTTTNDPNATVVNGELMVGGMPIAAILMWIARVAEIVMVAGLVLYTVRICQALIAARKG